jgi:hypothetical protein
MLFDYSDHIVLVIVQYFFPILLEIGYLCYFRYPNFFIRGGAKNSYIRLSSKNSVQSEESIDENQNDHHAMVGSGYWYVYLLPTLVAIPLFIFLWRMVVFTCLFFHTPLENLVAWLIGSLVVFLPLSLQATRSVYFKVYDGATVA